MEPGRGAGRAEGAPRLGLVAARRDPARAAGCRFPIGLDYRRGVPGARHRRRARDDSDRCRRDEPVSCRAVAGSGAGRAGIVLMDKAGWHTAGELCVPENLSIVFLPPYSPELNPIERLWLHLRDNRCPTASFRPPKRSLTAVAR